MNAIPSATGLVLSSLLPLLAQNGVPNLEALALRVGRAHHPDGPAAVQSFQCELALEVLDTRLKQGGQVQLSVQFLRWQRPQSQRRTTLMRYELRGGDEGQVRGKDRFGPWHRHQDRPTDLTGAQFVQDLRQFQEHLNLAKQLVRFLSPEVVMRELREPGEVTREQLRLTRDDTVPVLAVEGDLPRFPLMQNAGEEVPARLKIYVDERQDRVVAVDVWPLQGGAVDGEPDRKRGERIQMNRHRPRGEVLVPDELVHQWRDASGRLRPHSRVTMVDLAVNPADLTVDSFDRN